MLGPLITGLVLIFRHYGDARAAENAGYVGVCPRLRRPLELVAPRQVLRLHHVLGEFVPQGLPIRATGLAALHIAHRGHPPVADHWLVGRVRMVIASPP